MNRNQGERGWFQIHLSTAIVLMFVTGGLMWLNTRPQHYSQLAGLTGFGKDYWDMIGFGWPVNVQCHRVQPTYDITIQNPYGHSPDVEFSMAGFACDAVVAFLILVAVCGEMERRIN